MSQKPGHPGCAADGRGKGSPRVPLKDPSAPPKGDPPQQGPKPNQEKGSYAAWAENPPSKGKGTLDHGFLCGGPSLRSWPVLPLPRQLGLSNHPERGSSPRTPHILGGPPGTKETHSSGGQSTPKGGKIVHQGGEKGGIHVPLGEKWPLGEEKESPLATAFIKKVPGWFKRHKLQVSGPLRAPAPVLGFRTNWVLR